MTVFRRDILHYVERQRKIQIRWIEINNVINAARRHIIQKLLGGLAVRIDKSHSMTVLDILNRHILQKR